MPVTHSTITDNSLLAFGTANGERLPNGSYRENHNFDISAVFENGLTLNGETFTWIEIGNDGVIRFGNADGISNYQFAAAYGYSETRNNPSGEADYGIYIDYDTQRDSVVITYNSVGSRYNYSSNPWANTYQIEIIDRGNDDTEIVVRYEDMQWHTSNSWPTISSYWGLNVQGYSWSYRFGLPINRERDASMWDDVVGNTGVNGVWQFRFEDGVPVGADVAVGAVNLRGTAGDDLLNGYLANDGLQGYTGNDTLNGYSGNDVLIGGAGHDVIDGGNGHDTINAGDGDDSVLGGSGNDRIGAGDGDNTVVGGFGNDVIHSGTGADRLMGGEAGDYIGAGAGDDAINAGGGNDTVNAGDGNDTVVAANGQDTVYGGAGDDLLLGNYGRDFLSGDTGNDHLNGGEGGGTLLGGVGNDTLEAHEGSDLQMAGGIGDDYLQVNRSADNYLNDVHSNWLNYESSYYGNRAEGFGAVMNGDAGNDTLMGGRFSDTIGGQDGDDSIHGGGGNDSIGAGDGNDTVIAGDDSHTRRDNDWVYGGAGDDSLFGGGGDDTLFGGAGSDTLVGSHGRDVLLGGDGDDFIFGGNGYDVVTGGDGADRFFASTEGGDVTVITDYDATEGDWLVLDGRFFDSEDLRLFGERMYDLNGNLSEYRDLTLVRVDDDGAIAQTLFTFGNASQIERLIIRLPEDTAGETLTLDLF
ncbi:calcium-binding protein [Shimia sp. SDUM112013]|uniref:calcium-binding protein n=1 Tax=Shimia sp. SDUM112013 TaxID=3136160 RepID=UPI0032EA9B9B